MENQAVVNMPLSEYVKMNDGLDKIKEIEKVVNENYKLIFINSHDFSHNNRIFKMPPIMFYYQNAANDCEELVKRIELGKFILEENKTQIEELKYIKSKWWYKLAVKLGL